VIDFALLVPNDGTVRRSYNGWLGGEEGRKGLKLGEWYGRRRLVMKNIDIT
jgi:hypothetical protein